MIKLEPREAGVERACLSVCDFVNLVTGNAGLGRDDEAVFIARKCPAKIGFRDAIAIARSCVEKIDPIIACPAYGSVLILSPTLSHQPANRPTAEGQPGNLEAGAAKGFTFHGFILNCWFSALGVSSRHDTEASPLIAMFCVFRVFCLHENLRRRFSRGFGNHLHDRDFVVRSTHAVSETRVLQFPVLRRSLKLRFYQFDCSSGVMCIDRASCSLLASIADLNRRSKPLIPLHHKPITGSPLHRLCAFRTVELGTEFH